MNIQPDLKLIEAVSAHLADVLGEDFDGEAFWDTLDGETDVNDILDHLLNSMQEDETLADAIKSRADTLAARKKRIEARRDAKKATLKLILDATGQAKVERPLATVSKVKGRASVRITNEEAVPTQLCRITRSPDKTAIKKQIDAGEDVPGAEVVIGPETISVRAQ